MSRAKAKKNKSDAALNHDVATRQVAYDEKVGMAKKGKVGKKFAKDNKKRQQKTARKVREADRESRATQWHN